MFKFRKVKRMFEDDDPRLYYYLENQKFTISDVFKDNEDLIEKAIKNHKNTIAETAITYCDNLNKLNENNQSYLMLAVKHDNFPIFKLLLEKGVELNVVDNNKESLWFYLANNPNSEFFALVSDKDIEVKGFNLEGENALIYAYKKGRKDICLHLLDKQIFVNHIDKYGNTVLHYALWNNDLEFSYLLIEYGAHIFSQNYDQITPMDIAKEKGFEQQLRNKIVEYVDSLFKTNDIERINMLLLDYADNQDFTELNIPFLIALLSIKYDNKAIFEKVWRNPDLFNAIDYRGKSLLMYCIELGRLVYALKILYLNSNINLCDFDNRTVLFYIIERIYEYRNDQKVQNEYSIIIDELLDRHIDVNIQDVNGDTVLMLAIKLRLPRVIDQLIQYPDIDLNISNNDGKTALMLAYEMEDYRTFQQIIISRKADINKMDNDHKTLLLLALEDDNLELFDLLLKYGADLDIKYEGGKTILMMAINMKKTRFIVKIFEYLNFDVDIQDDTGKTALIHAVLNNDIKVVEALLKCGANPNIEDKDKNTAMLYALSRENFEIARIIKTYAEKMGVN